ncbi:MAG: AAA family ATPase [Nitrospinae bacterium]|nr:AAA family ATPase [Nitrospinota bacterium]
MTDLNAQNPLELEVKNFGPIAEAKIDLRPFTVFVGPSNTGKSYLAILIYALHRFFGDRLSGNAPDDYRHHTPHYNIFWDNRDCQLSAETRNKIVEWAEQTFVEKKEPSNKESIPIPEPIAGLVRSAYRRFDKYGFKLGDEIRRCFGINQTKALIRNGNTRNAQVIFRRSVSEDSKPFVYGLTIDAQKSVLETTIPEQTPMRLKSPVDNLSFQDLCRMSIDLKGNEPVFTSRLATAAMTHVFGPFYLPMFYLPADRTGIMHAHMALTSALIRSAPMAGLRQTPPTPMLSGVLADFIEQLIPLGGPLHETSQSHLGDQIEKCVLRGIVNVKTSETGSPRFTYRQQGWKTDLPLMNASSMVSELAPVVLYLRHVVQPDNVLIIEEPESHLHPAMQVEFTRQLAALVRAGVRVLITTHSEWVLEELANIVRLSGLSKAERKGIEGGDVALRPEEVGAWLFQPKNRPKGSVVKEIPLDDNSGLFPSGFDEVAVALHNNWAEISSRGGASG